MSKKYFVSYNYAASDSSGFGHTQFDAESVFSVKEAEKYIRDDINKVHRNAQVVVLYFRELKKYESMS